MIQEKFMIAYIDRQGEIEWPPKNSDVSSSSFFLRWFMKVRVHREKIKYLNNLPSVSQSKIKRITKIVEPSQNSLKISILGLKSATMHLVDMVMKNDQ